MIEKYYDNYYKRRQFVAHLVEFDKDQLFEINAGSLLGLTVDQITLYVRPEWSYLIMRHIKQAMLEQMDDDKVKFMADTRFNYPQMILIKNAFDSGFTIDEVKYFANDENLTYAQMHDRYMDIINKKKTME